MFGEVPMARTLYRKILDKHVVRAIDANTVLLYGSSSKPPSLNDGGADLFKRVTFDQVLKSVESSRER